MNNVLDKIKENKVNYDQVLSSCIIDNIGVEYLNRFRFVVIVPVRGRERFLPALIKSFIETNRNDYFLLVVEHSVYPAHKNQCSDTGTGYVYIPSNGKSFNKCLCFNIGVILAPKPTYLIFHDLDCLVQSSFFDNIDGCLDVNEAKAMQSFRGRRVLYCNQQLTDNLLAGDVNVNSLNIETGSVKVGDRGAPGGSILVAYDLFFKIGGYDPELFYSYSPEDAFFWQKIELFEKVYSCETNEVFHLNHPTSVNSNPDLPRLVKLMKEFHDLPLDHKMEIITYKQSLIKQYQ